MKVFGIEMSFEEIGRIWKAFTRWFYRKKVYDKSNVHILFIDDEHEEYAVIQNLENAGWFVKSTNDISNIEDDIVKNSQIIFVDYKGVGSKLSDSEQGLALIRLIKQAYGKSKRVILYSGYDRFNLGNNIEVADNKLPKSSSTADFIALINDEIKKLE